METNNSLWEKILNEHPTSKKGIFNRYATRKMLRSAGIWVSISFALLIVMLALHKGSLDSYYSLLNRVVDMALSLFPNLLGFCIGGYALIIGAGNINILQKMSKPLPDNKMSYFQILSSVFAMSLIIQCFTLFFTYIVYVVLGLELCAASVVIGEITNLLLIFLILACSSLSIYLLYYTVINIFNFGQVTHFSIRLDDSKNENQKDE